MRPRTRRPDRDARTGPRTRLASTGALLAVLLLAAAPAPVAHAASGGNARATADASTHSGNGAAEQPTVRGGDSLYAAGRVCTVSLNATDGTDDYAVSPGRCVTGADTWYADPGLTVPVGSTAGSSFPGNDYGLIRYTNPDVARPGQIDTGAGEPVDIERAASPTVGQSMCHMGRVSGLQCGTVTALDVSVNYPDGTVDGLFSSTAHSEPGDEGGPAFSGSTALGFIVGSGGGSTFYQPIAEVLSAYGLTLP